KTRRWAAGRGNLPGAAPLRRSVGYRQFRAFAALRPLAHSYRSFRWRKAMSKPCLDGGSNGCPAWIRTMTRRVKVACATITPPGSGGRKGYAAARVVPVKAGKGGRCFGRQEGANASEADGDREDEGEDNNEDEQADVAGPKGVFAIEFLGQVGSPDD